MCTYVGNTISICRNRQKLAPPPSSSRRHHQYTEGLELGQIIDLGGDSGNGLAREGSIGSAGSDTDSTLDGVSVVRAEDTRLIRSPSKRSGGQGLHR